MRALVLLSAIAAAAVPLLETSPAAAADSNAGFGELQPLVLSLENLGGVGYLRHNVESNGNTSKINEYQFGTFTPISFVNAPYGTYMRLGLHYFVAPPLSIGGLFNFSDNDQYGTEYFVGVRIGVAFPIETGTAIWLRAGGAYTHSKIDSGNTTSSYSAFVPGGEVLLVLQPVDNFGFLVGAMVEQSLGGKLKRESETSGTTQETDLNTTAIVGTFGVFAEF